MKFLILTSILAVCGAIKDETHKVHHLRALNTDANLPNEKHTRRAKAASTGSSNDTKSGKQQDDENTRSKASNGSSNDTKSGKQQDDENTRSKASKKSCRSESPLECTPSTNLCITRSSVCNSGVWACVDANITCPETNASCDPSDGQCKVASSPNSAATREQIEDQGSVPGYILDRFHSQFYDMIAADLVGRKIVSGTAALEDEPEYGFQTNGNAFSVSGYFVPDFDESRNATIRAYTSYGFSSETRVHSGSGYFSLGIVRTPPGRTPIILVVSSPDETSSTTINLSARKLEEPGTGRRVPCNIYSVNNEVCPPSLDLKLTWNGPTSDVDLHIWEENGLGEHVFYGNDTGEYGYLNVDDTDGLGPEHYYANILDEPQTFKTKVHMYDYNNDSIVDWKLDAKIEGITVDTWYGIFDEDENTTWSDEYSVTLASSSCMKCLSGTSSGTRELSQSCCPPKRYEDEGFWCSLLGLCGDELVTYKVWSDLDAHTNPSMDQVKGLAYLVFGHRSSMPAHNRNLFDLGMESIKGDDECLKSMWQLLLGIYCRNTALESALQGIYEGSTIISFLELLKGTAAAADSNDYIMAITDFFYGGVSGDILQEATNNLKSYTTDRALLSEFASGPAEGCSR